MSDRKTGVSLPPEILEQLRVLALSISHGSITLHLNAERSDIDIEVNTRERVKV